MPDPRMTEPTRRVLAAMLKEPAADRYGSELIQATGLTGGTLYPLLARLTTAGWLTSWWEAPEAHEAAGRPRRRYYRLTEPGAERARTAGRQPAPRGS